MKITGLELEITLVELSKEEKMRREKEKFLQMTIKELENKNQKFKMNNENLQKEKENLINQILHITRENKKRNDFIFKQKSPSQEPINQNNAPSQKPSEQNDETPSQKPTGQNSNAISSSVDESILKQIQLRKENQVILSSLKKETTLKEVPPLDSQLDYFSKKFLEENEKMDILMKNETNVDDKIKTVDQNIQSCINEKMLLKALLSKFNEKIDYLMQQKITLLDQKFN